MDIGIFDNFDDDGQLTLFGLEEDFGDLPEPLGEPEREPVHEDARGTSGKPEPERKLVREEVPGSLDRAEAEKQSARRNAAEFSGESFDGQGTGIRIRRCSSCGKLLFVREEDGGCYSSCNACGIQYVQK